MIVNVTHNASVGAAQAFDARELRPFLLEKSAINFHTRCFLCPLENSFLNIRLRLFTRRSVSTTRAPTYPGPYLQRALSGF